MQAIIELKCEVCQKKFERRLTEHNRNMKRGHRVFCGNSCSAKATLKDKIHSPQAKAKQFGNTNGRGKADEFTPFRYYFKMVKERSIPREGKRKTHKYNIDLQYLKDLWEEQEGKCPFTGKEMIPKDYKDELLPDHASLDRIDNSKGYIKGNVRFISVMANYARNTFTDEQVIEFCRSVANHVPLG